MIDHNGFLEVAKHLRDSATSDDSAYIRSSISRSYYFAFHHARLKLSNHPKANFDNIDRVKHHEYIIELLYELKQNEIAERMGKFRGRRNNADYDLDKNFGKQEAERWINQANWIADRISKI